jgi:hypothetical protein
LVAEMVLGGTPANIQLLAEMVLGVIIPPEIGPLQGWDACRIIALKATPPSWSNPGS